MKTKFKKVLRMAPMFLGLGAVVFVLGWTIDYVTDFVSVK